jgi:putative membrane protein
MLHGEVTLETVVTLVVFVAGCATGLLCFSKFLKWLLSRHETATMAVLCGFMCGSLRKIWPFQRDATPGILELKHKRFVNEWPEHFDVEAAWCIGLAIAAAAFVFILDRLTRGHEHAPHLSNDPPG